MTQPHLIHLPRRTLLTGAAALAFAPTSASSTPLPPQAQTEPFWGPHQGGIITPQQKHMVFAAFTLETDRRSELVALLRAWTIAAARMTRGASAQPGEAGFVPVPRAMPPRPAIQSDAEEAPEWQAVDADTGEASGMSPARLTLTFGFGPTLFEREGQDRFGLMRHRPQALADLPIFTGDQLIPAETGGDLCVQSCAEDPQVAFHALRQLARLAQGIAAIRWMQTGFLPDTPKGETPRNLMGFRDGTSNPAADDPAEMDRYVWVGAEGPAWMRGGSYLVNRRIRIALERWDRMKRGFQEETVGRAKDSGAPLGASHERDTLPLSATDAQGDPVIAENAHVRLATAATNDGARILRRGYSYINGVNHTAERWPPWHQGLAYDAGLLFVAFQRDPRTGFTRIFERMAKFDMMNQFVTHVGGGLFACPPGVTEGGYIGQQLFEES